MKVYKTACRGCIKGMSIIEQMYHPRCRGYPLKSVGTSG